MAVICRKNQGETNDHLLQRFKKMVRGARYVMEMKRHQRHEKPLTKSKIRDKAIMREYYRALRKKEEFRS